MKFSVKTIGLFIFASTFVASGCSGGGTDAKTNVSPTANSTTLTLSGVVTDDAIVNAGVVFSVGNREFSGAVPTGSNGEFQLEIESDDPNALVVGSALDAANGVRLSAVLDTFAGCVDRATNNVVSSVKITNVTTAQQVLAERLALDGRIDDYDEFLGLLPQIDGTELLELSSAIKVVVENINGTVLPSGFSDTLELARAIADGSSNFEADIELLAPGALMAAQNKLLSDGHATVAFDASTAPGVYSSVANDYIYAIFSDGSALVEYFGDQQMSTTPSWSIANDGKLNINFYGFIRGSDSLTLIGAADSALHMVTDFNGVAGTHEGRVAAAVTKFNFDGGFDSANAVGTYTDPQNANNSFVVQTGGAGYTINSVSATESGFSWSVNTKGHLVLDFTGSDNSIEIIKIRSGNKSQVLSVARAGGQFATLGVGSWNAQ